MKTVVLDAGHGGRDSGAIGYGRKEKDDVLKLVLAVGKKLDDYVDVCYTRKTDIYESVSKKASDANAYKGDLFVSFHRNSAGKDARGYETLVYSNDGKAKQLANVMNKDMEKIGFRNRGTKVRKDLCVLRKTSMVAVLCEFGFISNKHDNELFVNRFDGIVKMCVDNILEVLGVSTKKSTVKTKKGIVNTKSSRLMLREKAKATAKIKAKMPKGTVVEILKVGDKWHKVKYGGKTGYCSAKYIKRL
jgi:N-acetylmuramoyl-L-alanine amidase